MNPRALFVVDQVNGQGHIVRSRALAAELSNRSWRVTMMGQPPRSSASWDVSIVDGYIYGPEVYEALRRDRPVVAIVDYPDKEYRVDLLVDGSAGAVGSLPCEYTHCERVLAGPQYALLRPTFRAHGLHQGVIIRNGIYDVRHEVGRTDSWIAYEMLKASTVITYGGMRALEAACVGAKLELHPRNKEEERNANGLKAGNIPDGLGVPRVADAIEELVK